MADNQAVYREGGGEVITMSLAKYSEAVCTPGSDSTCKAAHPANTGPGSTRRAEEAAFVRPIRPAAARGGRTHPCGDSSSEWPCGGVRW